MVALISSLSGGLFLIEYNQSMGIQDFQKEVSRVFNEVPRIPRKKLHIKQSTMNHLTKEIARQIVSEEHRIENSEVIFLNLN